MELITTLTAEKIKEYTERGYWGTNTLLDHFEGCIKFYPDKIAVADYQGKRLTYGQLDNLSSRLAYSLREMGIQPGQVVSVQLPNWAEFTIAFVALLRLGAVINPVLPNLKAKELAYVLNKCCSSLLFIPNQFKGHNYIKMVKKIWPGCPNLKNVIVVGGKATDEMTQFNSLLSNEIPLVPSKNLASKANDVVIILFTSGTESRPKGVMHTHNTIIFGAKTFSRVLGLSGTDTILVPSTVGHATGCLHGVCLPIINGGQSVLLDIFTPAKALELIEREHCSFGMAATPFIHELLCYDELSKYDLSSLRFFLCGGAPIPRELVRDAFAAGFKLLAVYGSTESPPHTVNKLEDNPERIFSSDGSPMPGIEVKIVDYKRRPLAQGQEGEEASRGPNVCVGYLDEPELTAKSFDQEGWYYGGDLCVMDSAGYIKIVGRKKDIIIRGNQQITSREVENLLYAHPDISEAAIVAMPDQLLGEKVCVYIVLSSGRSLSLLDIQKYLAANGIARYKWPEAMIIIDKLPRTASGKLQKVILREQINKKGGQLLSGI